MEALTVVDHESGPSPTQGSFARFGSPPSEDHPQASPLQKWSGSPHADSPLPDHPGPGSPSWPQGVHPTGPMLAVWECRS
jgi:hypothetical protein